MHSAKPLTSKFLVACFVLLLGFPVAFAADPKSVFHLNEELEKAFGFSMAVPAGCLLFVGGLVGMDSEGKPVTPDDPVSQTDRIYDQLEQVLSAYELDLKAVVSETVYVTDVALLEAIGSRRAARYANAGAAFPSVAGVEVQGLSVPGLVVEATAIAYTCDAKG